MKTHFCNPSLSPFSRIIFKTESKVFKYSSLFLPDSSISSERTLTIGTDFNKFSICLWKIPDAEFTLYCNQVGWNSPLCVFIVK